MLAIVLSRGSLRVPDMRALDRVKTSLAILAADAVLTRSARAFDDAPTLQRGFTPWDPP